MLPVRSSAFSLIRIQFLILFLILFPFPVPLPSLIVNLDTSVAARSRDDVSRVWSCGPELSKIG